MNILENVEDLHVLPEAVFISYRRCDSEDIVGRIYDRLTLEFSKEHVFRDHEGINPGADFFNVIQRRLGESRCALVVIGQKWLSELNGRMLKDEGKDFVYEEVNAALIAGIIIIPVLVYDAQLPKADELKSFVGFDKLTKMNAIEVRSGKDFNEDMQRLVNAIHGNFVVQAPKEGEIVGGWLLNKLLSKKSSWGYSYLAEKDGKRQILKFLHQDFKCEKTVNRYVHSLINLLKLPKLDHIVQLSYPHFSSRWNTWFHTMDYIEGELLPKYFIITGLPFTHEMIYNCFIPLIRDLAVAHKAGVFHRNIKPGNLVYSPYNNKLVLTDYGLAIRNREASKSSYSSSITNFAAPEQLRGKESDASTDVYGLAATIYYSLDFNNPNLSDLDEFEPDMVPGRLGEVLKEALEPSRKKRIKNATEMADRLEWARNS